MLLVTWKATCHRTKASSMRTFQELLICLMKMNSLGMKQTPIKFTNKFLIIFISTCTALLSPSTTLKNLLPDVSLPEFSLKGMLEKILICTNLNLLNSARLFYFAAATLILNIIESDPAEATLKALSMDRTQEIQESMLAHQLHATRVLHQIRIMWQQMWVQPTITPGRTKNPVNSAGTLLMKKIPIQLQSFLNKPTITSNHPRSCKVLRSKIRTKRATW